MTDKLNELRERARYMVNNPSAWDTFDQGASDTIRDLLALTPTADEAYANGDALPPGTIDLRATETDEALAWLKTQQSEGASKAASVIRAMRVAFRDAVLNRFHVAADIAGVWQQAEDNHRRYSDTGDRETDIRFLTLGLTGEAGEVANFVKKRWRDGDDHDQDIRWEIADVCAYAFMLASTMGMSPADLIATIAEKQAVFIAKMKARDTGSGE